MYTYPFINSFLFSFPQPGTSHTFSQSPPGGFSLTFFPTVYLSSLIGFKPNCRPGQYLTLRDLVDNNSCHPHLYGFHRADYPLTLPDSVGNPFMIPHHRSIMVGFMPFRFPASESPSKYRLDLIKSLISHYRLDRVSRALRCENQPANNRVGDSRILVDVHYSSDIIASYSPSPQLYIILDDDLFAFYVPSSGICTFYLFKPSTTFMSEEDTIIINHESSISRLARWETGEVHGNKYFVGQRILKKIVNQVNYMHRNSTLRANMDNRGRLVRSASCGPRVFFQMGFVPFSYDPKDVELVEFTCIRWILRNVIRIPRRAFQEYYHVPVRMPITISDLDDSVHFLGFCQYSRLTISISHEAFEQGCFYVHRPITTMSTGDYCRQCKTQVLDVDSYRHYAMECLRRIINGEIITPAMAAILPRANQGGFELTFDS